MCDLLSLLFVFMLLVSASCEAQEIIYFQAANTSILRDVKHGFHFANFVKHQFKYLQVTPFISSLMPNEKKCHVWCLQNWQCLSLNVAVFPDSHGKYQCELLATDMFSSSSDMVHNMNYNHYSSKAKCHDKPCKNNGRCFPNYTTNTYSCQCQCPYYGYNCEKDVQNSQPVTPTAGCDGALGMQDGRILNSQVSASSFLTQHYAPWWARLHRTITPTDEACWAPTAPNVGEYLQIDLGKMKNITKVATQGKISDFQFVTRYSLVYSVNGVVWRKYHPGPCVKKFPGNTDQNTVVTNVLEFPFNARHVRIIVQAFHGYPILRCELYGC